MYENINWGELHSIILLTKHANFILTLINSLVHFYSILSRITIVFFKTKKRFQPYAISLRIGCRRRHASTGSCKGVVNESDDVGSMDRLIVVDDLYETPLAPVLQIDTLGIAYDAGNPI